MRLPDTGLAVDARPVLEGVVSVWAADGLVGRDAELACLRSLVVDVAAGRGQAVWVEGEPGIGKSSLLTAGLAGVEQAGCQLFAARADEAGVIFPLQVLLNALRVRPGARDQARLEIVERLWGGGSGRGVGSGDPVAAAAELVMILVDRLCAKSPLVLVVDDLQWADEVTLAVWGRLHRAAGQLPLLLVAAARPVPQRDEVHRLRHDLISEGAVVLELGPLSPAQVAAVVARIVVAPPGPRLQSQVGQASGNPLYVRELVNAMVLEHRIDVRDGVAELVDGAGAMPASLAAAIAARLNFLSEPATRALRMATLLGAQFGVEHLSLLDAAAAKGVVGAIEEGLAAGVLAESGSEYVFRHGLIHQALYETIPTPLRSALHRHAAKALAEAGTPAEKVAEQLVASPQSTDGWVVEWLIGAAPALTSRAPHIAVDLLQRVRDAVDDTDPHRTQLDVHLITALFQLGRYEEVEPVARPLLVAPKRDPEVAGRVAWYLAYALRLLGELEQALAVTGRALADRVATDRWIARVHALHATDLGIVGRYREAQDAASQAVAEAELAADSYAVAWALFALSMVLARDHHDYAAALKTLERATEVLGDEPETTDLRVLLLANSASTLFDLGCQAEADHAVAQALVLAERAGTPLRLATMHVLAAGACFLRGRWDDALVELDEATELPPHNPTRVLMRGLAALVAVHRDDRSAAETYLRGGETGDESPAGALGMADELLLAGALAAERDGQTEQALTRLLKALDPDSTGQFPRLSTGKCMLLVDVVRLALALGDRATAETATKACQAEADRQHLPATLAPAQHCLGLLDADPAMLLSAADAFKHLSYPLYQAVALEDAAVALAQAGDYQGARITATDALQIYADLDAAWDIRRADARLRSLGIRRGARGPRRRPPLGWEALTSTEVKIAHLVAAGRSNPDIAAELYLSRRTVQTHVSHIITKLEGKSRVDIARHVMTHHELDESGHPLAAHAGPRGSLRSAINESAVSN